MKQRISMKPSSKVTPANQRERPEPVNGEQFRKLREENMRRAGYMVHHDMSGNISGYSHAMTYRRAW